MSCSKYVLKSKKDFTYRIFWSEEDQAFIAVVTERPGLAAHGDSIADAAKEIETVIETVLELEKEDK